MNRISAAGTARRPAHRSASERTTRHSRIELTTTPRTRAVQAEVARLLAEGLLQHQIARRLGVSQPTVSAHKRALEHQGLLRSANESNRGTRACGTSTTSGTHPATVAGASCGALTPAARWLDEARARRESLPASVRGLRAVFEADEWVTDPRFKTELATLWADALAEIASHVAWMMDQLGTGLTGVGGGRPEAGVTA
jgi:DNA-binding CsgD family transcriptional regulator